jgi:hypothetical protein
MLWSTDGVLKDDPILISRRLGITTRPWNRIRDSLIESGKIYIEDGFIFNDKLKVTLKFVQNKSETSRKSAEKRWSKSLKQKKTVDANAHAIKDTKIKDNKYNGEFDNWYSLYPRRVGRGQAIKAYIKVRDSGTTQEALINGVKAYANSTADTEPKFIKHPQTWLNSEGWLDEYVSQQSRELDIPGDLAPVNLKAM